MEKEAILKLLLGEALDKGDFASAEELLRGEKSKAADWAIFGLRVQRKDYELASQWLKGLSIYDDTDEEFRNIQLINIERLQNPTKFQLSEEQEGYLKQIAESASPVRGYARGTLGLLKDQRFYPEAFEFSKERGAVGKTTDVQNIQLSPVPANHSMTVTWPALDSEATLQIFDMLGRNLSQEQLSANTTQHTLDTAKLSDGVYYLVITEKGKIVQRAKFTVQH